MKTNRIIAFRYNRDGKAITPVCDMEDGDLLHLIYQMRAALIQTKLKTGYIPTAVLTFDYLIAEAVERGLIGEKSGLITGITEAPQHEQSPVGPSHPAPAQRKRSLATNKRGPRPPKRPTVPRSGG